MNQRKGDKITRSEESNVGSIQTPNKFIIKCGRMRVTKNSVLELVRLSIVTAHGLVIFLLLIKQNKT